MLAIQAYQRNRFSSGDVTIHKILTAQVAVAVENANRFEALERTIQQLQLTQEKLSRQDKLAVLGQLAGSVGHELRNPLGVISNSVYFLQRILSEADKTTTEYLNLIADRVSEADKIIDDLFSLSRTQQVERSAVQGQHLFETAFERAPAPENIRVTTAWSPDFPPLFVNAQQIRQVLTNLITNAYQAMPDGGELTISAHTKDEWVQLFIKDSGTGMSAETMERIFEPLYTTKKTGIGFGLVISKNWIELNGGSIAVESTEGQGSTFTVMLPTVK